MEQKSENKKLRIGLISENSADSVKLKAEYPDTYVTHGRNVIEIQQQSGQNKLNAIVFLNYPNLKKDFFSFLQFLRQKKEFAQLPIAIISQELFLLHRPLNDPLVRSFQYESNLFMPLLSFFNSIHVGENLVKLITQDQIQSNFTKALGQKLGKETVFTSRLANDDEAHESFLCQLSDEISSNLLWIKFSARILERGSENLKTIFFSADENEMTSYIENLLTITFKEFKTQLQTQLLESGAVSFLKSEEIDGKERVPYVKSSKSFPLIFESKVCCILLEVIRYI